MKIGLEVHVALPTKTKLFCSDSTNGEEGPNSQICPICTGFPGSRPVLNKEAVRMAKSISLALNCVVKEKISFIRKVYFYPDLPKSFQITQLSESIGSEGFLELEKKRIRIRRIQMEEDPAQITRAEGYTLLDFNRSGIPLVEIVTEPDIATEEELREAIFTLRTILYYQGVDVNQEIKTDLNISLAEERVEIKNVTGIKNLVAAAEYEISRQGAIIKKGGVPEKETRSFDASSGTTKASRKKESEEEYGFIYEPDLTVYDTSQLPENVMRIPTKIARDFAVRHKANYSTILELIAFDVGAFNLINEFEDKFDFKTIIASLEIMKRFGEPVNSDIFKEILKLTEQKVDITKEVLKKIKAGEKIEIKKFSETQIDETIREMLSSDKSIVERYKKNKNVVNFIIGTISKKYGIQPREAAERVEGVINKL